MFIIHRRFLLFLGLIITAISTNCIAKNINQRELKIDDLFPHDQVLDVQITIDSKDWDSIRHQSRNFFEALNESRQHAPIDHPYTYFEASVLIDGVEFPQVGIRKKGFIGSQNSTRPSIKVKLNHVDKEGQIDGLTNLTFNNNQQDVSLISQFMGYGLFNSAGIPAPRCAYANVTVNGQDLGIYAHVERIHRPFLKREFGNDDGVLYEGTVVDFYPGWLGSFEHKLGSDEVGRKKIQKLIDVLNNPNDNIESLIGELVDLESFYVFWAMEGLLGFWDGYSGNRNNFFIYLNPKTDKFHFIPWGADSMFERYSPIRDDRRDPVSVKTQGLISNRLYQLKSGRQRYQNALEEIMAQNWSGTALLAETKRIQALVKPYLAVGDEYESNYNQDEARGWIEWARNASPEERQGAIDSEKFRNLSAKTQEMIIEGIDDLENVEQKESSRKVDKDKVEESDDAWEEGVKKQLFNQFDRALEQRRQFIRQRDLDITEEIAQGMPKWNAKPADPVIIPSFDNLKPKGDSIWSAAAEGNLNSVKKYLAKGLDINAKGGSLKSSALLSATLYDQVKMAEFLIRNGADVNAKGDDGGTALHAAAFLGQYEIAKLLIQNGADVDARNNEGETVINGTMADWETTKFIAGILQLKLDRESVETGRSQIVELLRKNGATAEFSDPPDNNFWTMAGAGNIQAVKQHLAKGIDVNAKGGSLKSSALLSATLYDQVKMAEFLIRNGADVNAKGDDGGTALHAAAFLGQYEIAKLLIQNGADVDARNNEGETVINGTMADWETTKFIAGILQLKLDRESVETGRSQIVELLRKNGATAEFSDPPDNNFWTMVGVGNLQSVKQHLAKGLDINAKNKDGVTALQIATLLGQYEIAELLVQKGADVNTKANDGTTALHSAAFLGRYKEAKLLLENRIDANIRNNDGATAIDILNLDWRTTQFVAQMLSLQVDKEKVEDGRNRIKKLLGQQVASIDNQSNQSDFVGQSLHEAVLVGNLEGVKRHIVVKSDLNQKDPNLQGQGASALHIASIFGQLEIVELLIQAGVDLNQADREGSTPVHAAAFFCHEKILLSLLNAGAAPTQPDNTGTTPLDSVISPWIAVQNIYNFVDALIFKPMGKPLDIERIKTDRPKIVRIIKSKTGKR